MNSAKLTQAIQSIQSGQRVFVHGAAATPLTLIEELVRQADRLRDVELMHLHTSGTIPYANPEFHKSFRTVNLFCGENVRKYLDYDHVDFLPCFLSEIPLLFRSGERAPDVALISVSPPDKHGYCSLGTSVDAARAAVETAKIVIAQVNPRMPRVHGDGLVHTSQIHHRIDVEAELPEHAPKPLTELELTIGRKIASLIEDGSCLQIGIGALPDAALASLTHHRHLGLHTEMWSDGCLELIRSGVIDNSQKKVHAGKSVSTFVNGTRALYDYIHDNPSVIQLEADYVNRGWNIARNPKTVAINSAVEIDLTGQVCADSIGPRIISGVGGQMDFIRGAALSPGGKPIIAVTSRSAKGKAKIVPELASGAGVVTTRAHVHYVVTEYGIAQLHGKTLHERARALISLAHPDDREGLERAWFERVKKATSRGPVA